MDPGDDWGLWFEKVGKAKEDDKNSLPTIVRGNHYILQQSVFAAAKLPKKGNPRLIMVHKLWGEGWGGYIIYENIYPVFYSILIWNNHHP